MDGFLDWGSKLVGQIWMSPEDYAGYCDHLEDRAVGRVQRRMEEMSHGMKWDNLETQLAMKSAEYEITMINNMRSRTDAAQAVNKARAKRWG